MNVPPLHQAIQAKDYAAAQAALERDASQATTALPGGISPLMFALYSGAHDIGALLREFQEPNLFEAAALNDARRVAELILADPLAVRQFSPDGWTALHLAGFFGSRDAAFVLLGLGAPLQIMAQNPTGNTPLHASIAGVAGESLASLLMGFGADPRVAGGDGVTPLHLAAARGFDGLCRLLVSRGADRRALTLDEQKTPGTLARERGHGQLAAWLDEKTS